MATYTCKYCGHQSGSVGFVGMSCNKSPHGKHELLG